MLMFKKKFIDKIRSGEKTQTIRLWNCRRMKDGQRSFIPGVGYICITKVEAIQLADLTDADAVPDGFAAADLLREEIQTIYGKKTEQNVTPYRICFEVYPPDVQKQMREAKKSRRVPADNKVDSKADSAVKAAKTLSKLRRMAG